MNVSDPKNTTLERISRPIIERFVNWLYCTKWVGRLGRPTPPNLSVTSAFPNAFRSIERREGDDYLQSCYRYLYNSSC